MQIYKARNISANFSIWWTQLSKVERSASLTIAGITSSIQLFSLGIYVGRLAF